MNPQSFEIDRVSPHYEESPNQAPQAGVGKRRRRGFFLLAGLVIVCTSLIAGFWRGMIPSPFSAGPQVTAATSPADRLPTVKVVRPKRESSVAITVDQIATVEPYYRADLRARASGLVKLVSRDIGDKVKKGDILLVIDVPESDQDIAKCAAMIIQRKQELKVSEARLKDAKAAKDVSAATITQREAEVKGATATRDLKLRKYKRFQELAAKGSVVGNLVEEEERDYLASEATLTSAKANVERARADFAESESKVEAAAADIELKLAQIEVARKDLDRAQAVANYARIEAPFDGVVVRRNVDPGSFVQNATTGTSEVLMSIAKVDLVTVCAKFPDAVAPAVAVNTPALVTVDDLPGVSIPAAVTRFAPTVQNADHTMRVEVDLFNGDEEDYQRISEAVRRGDPERQTKSAGDPMPVRAFAPEMPKSRRLIPGMTGTIRLTIGGFGDSYVLPSTAVYSRSGTSYILLVQAGKTRQTQVRVQVNDGKTVRLALLEKQQDERGGHRDVLTELTGNEEIAIARQLEVGNGSNVITNLCEW